MGEAEKEGQAIRKPYIELGIRSGKAERQTNRSSSKGFSNLRNPRNWAGYLNFEPDIITTLSKN